MTDSPGVDGMTIRERQIQVLYDAMTQAGLSPEDAEKAAPMLLDQAE
jgi:hypothetical protein